MFGNTQLCSVIHSVMCTTCTVVRSKGSKFADLKSLGSSRLTCGHFGTARSYATSERATVMCSDSDSLAGQPAGGSTE